MVALKKLLLDVFHLDDFHPWKKDSFHSFNRNVIMSRLIKMRKTLEKEGSLQNWCDLHSQLARLRPSRRFQWRNNEANILYFLKSLLLKNIGITIAFHDQNKNMLKTNDGEQAIHLTLSEEQMGKDCFQKFDSFLKKKINKI
jgi:hypothetical protein